ncbi:MAG TPA: Hsp20/alpha crystallin family protein [Firmicutes bacterium]|nr:Hsp20/alpha crystallin family protein [Bacillota bacterium]
MADITRWNPIDDISRWRDDVNRFFQGLLPWGDYSWPRSLSHWGPSVDVKETDTDVHIMAEVPGVDPGDIDITVTEDSLTIKGEVKHEEDQNREGYRRIERRYGSFHRVIPFPVKVKHDQATADYRNGILEVKVPKAEPGKMRAFRLKVTDQPKQLQ